MKILLLIPPTDLKRSYGKLKNFSNPQPAIGLAYIASVLVKNGYEVKVIDGYVAQYDLSELTDTIRGFRPDVVGISVLTPSADIVYEISKDIRSKFPSIKIVMGNLHASLFANDILANGYADIIVHHEGEFVMLEYVKALENGAELQEIKNISFKKNGAIINTPQHSNIEDLDRLPFPAWELFSLDKYKTDPRTEVERGESEMQILASRGCPNQCTFCSSRTDKHLGNKYRMRDPKAVVDEMVYMNKKFGSRVFSFTDLAFPLVREHAISLCNELINGGFNKKVKWFTECRVKPLDQELLILMKRAGCVRINFGIESGNDEILQLIKKNFTTDDVRRAIEMTRRAGIVADGMFMLGLPEETEETIKKTVDFTIELELRYAIFNLFVPYPGSELYELLKKSGKIRYKTWSDFTSYPAYTQGVPVYVPDGLTCKQIMRLQRYAMRKFYLRPQFVFNEMKRFSLLKLSHYYHGLTGIIHKGF